MHLRTTHLISLFSCLIGFSFLQAQQNSGPEYTLTGKVIDGDNVEIPYASIAVYHPEDSTMVSGSASDDDGFFSVQVPSGNYFIKVNFLSFEERILENVRVENNDLDLGEIKLVSSSVALDAVQITAEKSQMQMHLDKRVFNVGKDITNRGSNAAQILDNLPSVNTDIEGNVSLRGSQNVRILIDGKPSGMAQATSLRQLQGNMIETIEVITNPSARYDAEGEVGIINIILKKEKREGLNGSFEAFTGWPHNHGAGINMNYRKSKVNLFSNYSINYRSNPGSGYSLSRFFNQDTTFSYERFREHTRSETSNNFQLGSDFFLNDYNTLTLSGLYSYSEGINEGKITYNDYDDTGALTETTARDDEELETENELELTFDYRKTFPQKDRAWNTSVKYSIDDDTELSDITESSNDGTGPIYQMTSNTEDEANLLFQTDYIHPFGEDGKFEVGLKATFREIENNYRVEELINNDWIIDPDFDDNFKYFENIYAGYLIAGHKSGRFSYQGGIRLEYSDITTRLLTSNQKNNRNYLDYFPSVHFSFEMEKSNTLQLSYSRRLSRPHFRHLLPYSSFTDNRNLRTGNPNLQPEYTHSVELGHLKYFESGSVLTSIYYRYRTGVIERIDLVQDDSDGDVITLPVNLASQNAYGLEFSLNYDPFQWWKLTGNFNFYRAITEGQYEDQVLESDAYTWNTRFSSKMTLFRKLDWQLSFNYRAPEVEPQGRDKAYFSADSGLAMDILDGNGTLTLSVRDIFNTRRWRSVTETDTYYSESEFQWRTRSAQLTFNYRLNQKKNNRQDERGNGNFEGGDDGF